MIRENLRLLTETTATADRAVQNRIASPGLGKPLNTRSSLPLRKVKPFFLHLIYGDRLPIDRETRRALEARVRVELNRISQGGQQGSAFFIVEHHGDMNPQWIAVLGPRDIPIYLLRPEAAPMVGELATQHLQMAGFSIAQEHLADLRAAIAGGTIDDEPGRNINFEIQRVRRGVSFIRVWQITRSKDPVVQGTFFGEGVLHEFGHHLLDDPQTSAHRFGGIMDPAAMKFGSGEHHFTSAAIVELRKRIAKLP